MFIIISTYYYDYFLLRTNFIFNYLLIHWNNSHNFRFYLMIWYDVFDWIKLWHTTKYSGRGSERDKEILGEKEKIRKCSISRKPKQILFIKDTYYHCSKWESGNLTCLISCSSHSCFKVYGVLFLAWPHKWYSTLLCRIRGYCVKKNVISKVKAPRNKDSIMFVECLWFSMWKLTESKI